MEYKELVLAVVTIATAVTIETTNAQEGDYSEPIKCYYCFGPANNSSCADPVVPSEDKGKSLQVIQCDSGICLKWTHYYKKTLYMHRTCSQRLYQFKIMMIDGVCRSERTGNGQLCMCGRNLCNSAKTTQSSQGFKLYFILFSLISTLTNTVHS